MTNHKDGKQSPSLGSFFSDIVSKTTPSSRCNNFNVKKALNQCNFSAEDDSDGRKMPSCQLQSQSVLIKSMRSEIQFSDIKVSNIRYVVIYVHILKPFVGWVIPSDVVSIFFYLLSSYYCVEEGKVDCDETSSAKKATVLSAVSCFDFLIYVHIYVLTLQAFHYSLWILLRKSWSCIKGPCLNTCLFR